MKNLFSGCIDKKDRRHQTPSIKLRSPSACKRAKAVQQTKLTLPGKRYAVVPLVIFIVVIDKVRQHRVKTADDVLSGIFYILTI